WRESSVKRSPSRQPSVEVAFVDAEGEDADASIVLSSLAKSKQPVEVLLRRSDGDQRAMVREDHARVRHYSPLEPLETEQERERRRRRLVLMETEEPKGNNTDE